MTMVCRQHQLPQMDGCQEISSDVRKRNRETEHVHKSSRERGEDEQNGTEEKQRGNHGEYDGMTADGRLGAYQSVTLVVGQIRREATRQGFLKGSQVAATSGIEHPCRELNCGGRERCWRCTARGGLGWFHCEAASRQAAFLWPWRRKGCEKCVR